VVSDRDPSPVRNYLADLAGVPVADFPECDVRRATPDAWVLETTHP
jgi:ATP-binding protein involved in chromosome partitioning